MTHVSFEHNGFHSQLPTPDDEVLDELERRLGLTIPMVYRAFLKEHNGGNPVPEFVTPVPEYPVGDGGYYNWDVAVFFYIGSPFPFLDLEQNQIDMAKLIPPGFLYIGDSGGGDKWCLQTQGSQAGSIFILDKWFRFPLLVADSFESFLTRFSETSYRDSE